MISWGFTVHGDPVLKNINSTLPTLTVNDPLTQEVHSLQFLSPCTAYKTLGYYKEPAGTLAQCRELRAKSDKETAFLWKCQITPVEAWTYYFACYLPSIGYPLCCSSLTYKELDRVQ
jgi:hypothetical protein